MKKLLFVLIAIALCALFLASCHSGKEPSYDPSVVGDCVHDWSLTSFVTEETEMPFAARYTCSKCGETKIESFNYTDIEIPLVSVTGVFSVFVSESGKVNDEIKIPFAFSYRSVTHTLECAATLKLQGKSSRSEPKKNYSVNLFDTDSGEKKNFTFNDSWGEGNKYVLKANYSEPSSVRNVALSALYGQMAHDRDLADHYTDLVNCGAVDGYPVLLYVNGQYHGLYNWVIRKDKWLFGMGDENAGEAVLEGSDVDAFKREEGVVMLPEGMRSAKSWEEEYVNENYGEEGWAEDSFNAMLFAIRGAEADRVREAIAEYVELERTLDVMLFNCVFATVDNVCGNQVWCTFDGRKWSPVPYDLDRTLGRSGNCPMDPDEDIASLIPQNVLYDKIVNAYFEEIAARYSSLRKSVFTTENVMSVIREKLRGVDDRYFLAELEKWPDALWRECEGSEEITDFEAELGFIEEYLEARFACCDAYFAG